MDAGYKVNFEKSVCFVGKEGVKATLGYRKGSLYYLLQETPRSTPDSNPANSVNLGLATYQSPGATLDTWHRRLCHRTLDNKTIQYILSKVSGMEVTKGTEITTRICGICAKGRQYKEAQTKTREKARELLLVVHTDLCGPMQTPSLHGEQYLITFTDELSGRVSVCLLNRKDGALAAFQAYRARTEKASGQEIKSLRSDGGGEYINQQF